MCREFYSSYGDLLIIIISCLVWAYANGFVKGLETHAPSTDDNIYPVQKYLSHSSWLEVERVYSGLKHLSELVNNLIGVRLIVSLIRITLLSAVNFEGLDSWSNVFGTFIGLTGSTIFLIASADVNRQVDKYFRFGLQFEFFRNLHFLNVFSCILYL